MGRGQGNRSPLKLAALDLQEVVFPDEVSDVSWAGSAGMRVTLQNPQGQSILVKVMLLDLLNSDSHLFVPDSYYVAVGAVSRRELVTGDFCSCGALKCRHQQAVIATRAEFQYQRSLSTHVAGGVDTQAFINHALVAGTSWYASEDSLVAYALRLGDNQGQLAFHMWAHVSLIEWSEVDRVHSLSGICKLCKFRCVEGQLLSRLLADSTSAWDASVLTLPQVQTRLHEDLLHIEGGFGEGFSYLIRRTDWLDTDGQRRYQYTIYARLRGKIIATLEEDVVAGKVVGGACVGQECPHAPWRKLYEKHADNPLARIRRKFLTRAE